MHVRARSFGPLSGHEGCVAGELACAARAAAAAAAAAAVVNLPQLE